MANDTVKVVVRRRRRSRRALRRMFTGRFQQDSWQVVKAIWRLAADGSNSRMARGRGINTMLDEPH